MVDPRDELGYRWSVRRDRTHLDEGLSSGHMAWRSEHGRARPQGARCRVSAEHVAAPTAPALRRICPTTARCGSPCRPDRYASVWSSSIPSAITKALVARAKVAIVPRGLRVPQRLWAPRARWYFRGLTYSTVIWRSMARPELPVPASTASLKPCERSRWRHRRGSRSTQRDLDHHRYEVAPPHVARQQLCTAPACEHRVMRSWPGSACYR